VDFESVAKGPAGRAHHKKSPSQQAHRGPQQVSNKVFAQAKPENADFAKLVAWLSNGACSPALMTSTCYGCSSGRSCRKLAGWL
jgi:hypothetical protein